MWVIGSGLRQTGRSVTAHGVDIHLLRDGRLAEHWTSLISQDS